MVNYTLKQLYSFEAVIRLSSFALAAKELNITQPAVYMQVKQLQKNIGGDIVIVVGKQVNATFIGKKLLTFSRKIITELELGDDYIKQTLNPDSGHLNIAVATTANSFISKILADFKKQNPKMTFYLEVTNRYELIEKLRLKQSDFVIMGEPPENLDIISKAFMQNPLIAICHPEHSLLAQKNIEIQSLYGEILITREKNSGTRKTIERITGLKFNSEIEINSNESIISAVRAGLGIGFVSEWTVELELQAKVIAKLPIKGFPILRNWHIVHTNKDLSLIANKFKKFVLEV